MSSVAVLGIHMDPRCETSSFNCDRVCNVGNSRGTEVHNLFVVCQVLQFWAFPWNLSAKPEIFQIWSANMPFMISSRTFHKSVVACRYLSRIYSCEGFRVVKILPLVF